MSSDGLPTEGGEPATSVDGAMSSVSSRRLHAAGIAVFAVRSLRELGLTLAVVLVVTIARGGGQ